MKKISLSLSLSLFLFFAFEAGAYIPTLDSLLKNGKAKPDDDKTYVVNFKVFDSSTNYSNELNFDKEKNLVTYHKVYLNFEKNKLNLLHLVQVSQDDDNKIHKLIYRPNFNFDYLSKSNNKPPLFFYSFLMSQLIGESSWLIKSLKENNVPVSLNKEIIISEKQDEYKRLIDQQQSQVVEGDKRSNDELNLKNSLKTSDSFYYRDSFVSQKIQNNILYWSIQGSNIEGLVDYRTRHWKKFILNNQDLKWELYFDQYFLVGANSFLPSRVLWKYRENTQEKSYSIEFTKTQVFSEKGDSFNKRLKSLNQSVIDNKVLKIPDFVL